MAGGIYYKSEIDTAIGNSLYPTTTIESTIDSSILDLNLSNNFERVIKSNQQFQITNERENVYFSIWGDPSTGSIHDDLLTHASKTMVMRDNSQLPVKNLLVEYDEEKAFTISVWVMKVTPTHITYEAHLLQ